MNKYSVIIQPKAIDELSRIEKRTAKKITSKLTWLSGKVEALNLFSPDSFRLGGVYL